MVAHASSETKARRAQVCGRPGSETDTDCAEGWQQIDKRLELCDGKLSDKAGADGACFADYEAVGRVRRVGSTTLAENLSRDAPLTVTGPVGPRENGQLIE